ncbi:MAG: type II secretion system minor pseudopilin GspK [Pseudomonadota bacterium]
MKSTYCCLPKRGSDKHHIPQNGQQGVALIIVLLLTASLSFIALGVTTQMRDAVSRTRAGNDRMTLHWRALSTEVVAQVAIEKIVRATSQAQTSTITPITSLFLRPITVPLPSGTAEIVFSDATRCINLNSLQPRRNQGSSDKATNQSANSTNQTRQSAINSDEEPEQPTVEPDAQSPSADRGFVAPVPVREFQTLAVTLGLSEATASRITDVIIDWIDTDDQPEQFGAEDNFYTTLPVPFRTGGGLLADVSEIRSMEGINRQIYRRLAPYLCAWPGPTRSKININMLQRRDAPILVALTGGEITLNEASDIIDRQPPSGWESINQFWVQGALSRLKTTNEFRRSRTALTSDYIKVTARLSINEIDMVDALLFRIIGQGGTAQILSREFGAPS